MIRIVCLILCCWILAFAGNAQASQPLSALCSGPAAHDLKIHLTDVRNQDDTLRDSGDATFRVCDNIANVGRDAPRHIRSGNVYDEYVVSGLFVYATSVHQDPLLYAQCNVDIFTKASDGVSPGDIRWVCHVHNSWENVAAGSTGNAGNPGPAGFANDPQSISYRAEIDDGASDVLDWSGLDATVTSASNPMQPNANVGCQNGAGTFCMNVPSSTGTNQWYYGQATRATCSSTCVGGVTNGQLYYAYPSGSAGGDFTTTQYVSLMLSPMDSAGANFFMTGSQGTGTTTFSTRFQHYHWSTWQTLDYTGLDNWSPFGSATRVTRKVYPAFTPAEKLYWQQTGLIIPLNLSQATGTVLQPHQAEGQYYEPFGKGNVIGFQGPGDRPDLGISSEWAAQAFISGTEQNWDWARLFTLGTSTQGQATILNEATGRLPPLNNGPPTGPGGNGSGSSYAGLGAPQPGVSLDEGGSCRTWVTGMADVPHDLPNATYPADLGQWFCGTYISHMPSFNGFTYPIFGSRHFLDVMRWHGNQDYAQQRVGPGPVLGQGYYRDNNAVFTDGHTYHYYGLMIDCCQSRGSAWLIRDLTYPAPYGSDSDPERSYFNDFLVETRNYYPLWLTFKDGPGNTNYTTSITPPNAPGSDTTVEPFILDYTMEAAYQMVTYVHEPLGSRWMTKYQRYWEGLMGGQLSGAPVSYYVPGYFTLAAFFNGDGNNPLTTDQGGNLGQYTNGVDGSAWGVQWPPYMNILTGGQLQQSEGFVTLTVGDQMKNFTVWYGSTPIDQLSGSRFYTVIGPIDNTTNLTFYLQCNAADHVAFPSQCPVAGAAFTGFTRGGVPVVNEIHAHLENPLWRPQFDPGPCQGYLNPNYVKYAGNAVNSLNVLGYSVGHAMADFNARCGPDFYTPTLASFNWDPTVVIPGLPVAVNGVN